MALSPLVINSVNMIGFWNSYSRILAALLLGSFPHVISLQVTSPSDTYIAPQTSEGPPPKSPYLTAIS
jgi:hypothetical protein